MINYRISRLLCLQRNRVKIKKKKKKLLNRFGKDSKTLALHRSFPRSKWVALFNTLYVQNATNPAALRAIYYLPPPSSPRVIHPTEANVFTFTFVSRRVVCIRVFESPFTMRLTGGRGVNEEPQVARKGCFPFSPPVVTQSVGRPSDLAVARDFHGVTRFPADITFDIYIYGAPVKVRSATVDWSYALTPRE